MFLNKSLLRRTFINSLKLPDLKFDFNELEPVLSTTAL